MFNGGLGTTPQEVINRLLRHVVKPTFLPRHPTPLRIKQAQWRFKMLSFLFPTPKNVSISPLEHAHLHGEWIDPENISARRVMLYLHGGAYILGSPRSHRDLTAALAHACRCKVLALDYQQAPEHAFPAWLNDAVAAYRWLLGQGIKPQKILLAGDSAGGNLVLATLLKLRDEGVPLPGAGICLSPWTDLTSSGASMRYNADQDVMLDAVAITELGRYHTRNENPRHPYLSPVFGNYRGLPPLLIHVGSTEILLDDARRAADNATRAGIPVNFKIWPNQPHVFQFFVRFLPEAKEAVKEIGEFVESALRRSLLRGEEAL